MRRLLLTVTLVVCSSLAAAGAGDALRVFHDTQTGLQFRYLAKRHVTPCADSGSAPCFRLAGPGMRHGSAWFVQFDVVDGSLDATAASLWDKEGDHWRASGRGGSAPVATYAGDGWTGLVANVPCGIGDENGFHGMAGDCFTWLMSNGKRTVIMTTDGASGQDPATLASVRSVRWRQ